VRAAARFGAALAVAAGSVDVGLTPGCGDNYTADLDSLPIVLHRAPLGAPAASGATAQGALLLTASPPGAANQTYDMVVGTGTPLTLLAGAPTNETEQVGFDLIDPTLPNPPGPAVRGTFRGVSVLRLPLQAPGDGGMIPGAIMGGDILRRYSVQMRLGATCPPPDYVCSSVTFWSHLGPDLGFLEDSGYAALKFSLFGGGEVTAKGDPDFLGQRGPLVLSPTRIVLRTCAAPAAFSPDQARDMCCKDPDAARLATGIDLALLLDTGTGPMVLGQSAWDRVKAKLTDVPVESSGQLLIATWPTAIAATWSTIPRFAVVDNETEANVDPGPCVELGRSRRIEQVSFQTVNGIAPDACTQPCDNDPREPDKAQNSAAYLELTGPIPVAVIADEEPYLQGLRFDVRPEGPEVDGLIGAGALGRARLEIDYQSAPGLAVFSCELDAPRSECWAAARCPRLPSASDLHRCFGLPPHGLAPTCAPSGC